MSSDPVTRERVAVYAGAGKARIYINGEWKSVEREQIKKAVKERTTRLIVATDAACEGLNLQTLGTLINVDLPWYPSRLEQRIGRIKRYGQRRDRVDMLNLLYHGFTQPTVDEKVYAKLSARPRLTAVFPTNSICGLHCGLEGILDRFKGDQLCIVEFAIYSFDPANIDIVDHVARLRVDGHGASWAFPRHAGNRDTFLAKDRYASHDDEPG